MPAAALTTAALLLLCNIGEAGLTHRYTFENGSAEDSAGSADGTLVGTTGAITGGFLDLTANDGENSNDAATANGTGGSFVNLPNGIVSAAVAAGAPGEVTFEYWVRSSVNRDWAAIGSFGASDFGENTSGGGFNSPYIQLIPQAGGAGVFRATTHQPANGTEGSADANAPLSTAAEKHLVIVIDQSGGVPGTIALYIDKVLFGPNVTAAVDFATFSDNNNWLGRSQWADPLFDGTINEFRIYNHALTPAEVGTNFTAGPMVDTDGDGLDDNWERSQFGNLGQTGAGDPDSDGSLNLEEFEKGTGTLDPDSDDDGSNDGNEAAAGTDPLDEDSDDDGLFDGVETKTGTWAGTGNTGTDPLDSDSDNDGLLDGEENPDLPFTGAGQPGTNPNLIDTDGDGFFDLVELANGSDPTNAGSVPDTGGGLDNPEAMAPYFNGVFPETAPGAAGSMVTEVAFPNLSFASPMHIAAVPGGNMMAVVEKDGRIHLFDNTPEVSTTSLLLDLAGNPPAGGSVYINSDCGMTAVAFHPDFTTDPAKRFIYVPYKWRPNGGGVNGEYAFWRLSRFHVPVGTLDADESSELVMVQQFDRQMWHDSGCLLFGDDGFLYFSIGDEGAENDFFNVGQQLDNRLFCGMFRIDVDSDPARSHAIRRQPVTHPGNGWAPSHVSFTTGYMIPNDNPFLDPAGGLLEEYFCHGLRNTFKFYIDPATGTIYGGDLGQSAREEFNIYVRGGNYGWPYREGSIAGPKAPPDPVVGTPVEPLWEYGSSLGHCIVAGAVYRGSEFPELYDRHIVFDNVSQRIWALTVSGAAITAQDELALLPGVGFFGGPTSAGVDHNGELYITKLEGGRIYKLARQGTTISEPPLTLSATGLFSDLATLTPAAGLFPYTPNAPLWSDGAAKWRWVGIPNDGVHDTAAEKIGFRPDGNWTWPEGTILVKHFELPVDEDDPGVTVRVETRVVVVLGDGSVYGVTYKWRDDQSDADLLPGPDRKDFTINLTGGGSAVQTWNFPGRSQCLECHTPQTGRVLGLRTHQLNGAQYYPRSGRLDNQLATMHSLGWFDAEYRPEFLPYYLKARRLDDASAPLEDRVRSYLDSNCSQCHQPGGVRAFFDARFTTPLFAQNLIHGNMFGGFLGPGEAVVKPGDAGLSVAHWRMTRLGDFQMPPIARNLVDQDAVATVAQWINSLEARPGVTLSSSGGAAGSFDVMVQFTGLAGGLTVDDFAVSNGVPTGLVTGADASSYTLTVTPAASGNVSIYLPENSAIDGASLGNYPSNLLTVAAVDSTLITWIGFEDGSGNTASDQSGNGNDGTLVNMGGGAWVPGACDTGLAFDGADDFVEIDNLATGDFTVAVWINTTQSFAATDHGPAATGIAHSDAAGITNDWVLGAGNWGGLQRAIFFTGNPQINILGTSNINTREWVHLAATREASTGTMRLYVNGIEEVSTTGANVGNLDANPLVQIGGGGNKFNGLMDEFRFYNRVLDAAGIQLLQSCTLPDSPYVQWAKATLPGLTHLQAPSADPEHDGIRNILEWGFDSDPLAPNPSPVAAAINGNGRLTFTFPRRESVTSPVYTIWLTEDLLNWSPGGNDVGQTTVQDLPGPTELVTFEYTGPLGAGGRLFGVIEVHE